MQFLKKVTGSPLGVLLAALLLLTSQVSLAQGNSGESHGKGKNRNVGVGNASDGIQARVVTSKRIYYTGDPLEISVQFVRGADLLSGGEVDASVVIFSPASGTPSETDSTEETGAADSNALTEAIVMPLTVTADSDTLNLFTLESVDISSLPAGTYQLGLVLTRPDGDLLNINDWYRGLLGLVNIVGLTITDTPVDFDDDGDGMVDNDSDGDGFSDDDSGSTTTTTTE